MKLEHHIRQIIHQEGYITIASAMEEILTNRDNGYYITNTPIGKGGDFITSPEISQIFGELIGLWCADVWHKMGSPPSVNLIELGPGNGTMMDDMLRATKNIPGFHSSITIHLVEISPALRKVQATKLANYPKIKWYERLEQVPPSPSIIVANEFLDCLPIHQYVRRKDSWMEQAIILTRNEDLIFSQVPIKKSLAEFLNAEYSDMQIGSIIEMCPHAISLADLMANMMHNHKSAALMIDYGYDYDKSKMEYLSPTLQAIKNHNFHPVLSDIGYADLTAHVDFFSLRQAAILREIQIFGTVTQGEFLNSLGVQMRLQQLLSNASAEQGIELTQGTERLVSNSQMGELFKVMCLTSPGLGDMAGF